MSSQISVSEVEPNQTSVRASVWVKRLGAITLIVVLMTLLLIAPQLVQAESHTASPTAQWRVNTAVDENDGSCSDGDCSLRDAIALAANGDTITFGGDYTIYLNSQLDINKPLTIDGSGHTIKVSGDTGGDGSSNVRVFYIGSTGVVTLTHLSIVNGTATNDGSGNHSGGGVYNIGTLTVQSSTFISNSSYFGGGISNSGGTVTVQKSTFIGNSSSSGGGIYNTGTMTDNGTLTVQNSTFFENSATVYGGAIANGDLIAQGGTSLSTVQNSTFSGNSALLGGGIYSLEGQMVLANTIVANSSAGSDCYGNIDGYESTTNIIGRDPLLAPLGDYGGDVPTLGLLPGSPALNAGDNATCLSTDQRGVVRPQPSAGTCDIGAFESRGFTLTYGSGNNQTTPASMLFAAPLQLTVTSGFSEPVNGGQVILSGPENGAGITPMVYTATLHGGMAAQVVRANSRAGSYTVSADLRGNWGSSVNFNLTNAASNLVVLGNGLVIADGDGTPALADQTDFGNLLFNESMTRTFTVSNNSSTTSLTLNGLNLSGAAASDFTLVGLTTPVTLPANSTRTFQARLAPTLLGTRVATVTLTRYEGDQDPYDFAIQGTGRCVNSASVTNASDAGLGSLRQAIAFACEGGTINFIADATIYLNSQLEISKTLTIDGSGRMIKLSGDSAGDGSPNVRVLSIGSSGVVTLTHLSIVNGTAASDSGGINNGGGVYNAGSLTIQDSTFSGNLAPAYGGGLFNQSAGILTLWNSTFSGNSTGVHGGGLANYGTSTVRNSTFSDNSAGVYGGGIFNVSSLYLYNTLIANSPSGGDCRINGGTIAANDHNLIEGNGNSENDGTCGLIAGAGGSLIGVDPWLAPLANNGGGTLTHALLPGSPVLEAGNNVTCLPTDQRGVTRPQMAQCDIGAYEAPPQILVRLTKFVTPTLNSPANNVVTYTLALNNLGSVVEPQALLTDTLPAELEFKQWVTQPSGAVVNGNTIRWTGALASNSPLTVTFQATRTAAAGQPIINTAYFSGTTHTAAASAEFSPACLSTFTVRNAHEDGPGSLRQAIAGMCPDGRIDFAPSLSGQTITLASPLLLAKGLTVDGSTLSTPVTISGNDAVSIFRVSNQARVTLGELSLSHGKASAGCGEYYSVCGGALTVDDGATVTLTHSSVLSNTSAAPAIMSNGSLTILGSTFSNNNSPADAGVALYCTSTCATHVISSTFSQSVVAVATMSGNSLSHTLTVQNSIFSDESPLQIIDSTGTVQNSTFISNSSGLQAACSLATCLTTVSNNTFARNRMGIINEGGKLILQNDTLADNGRGVYNRSGTLAYTNTIIANSTVYSDCLNTGTIAVNVSNLVEDGSCSTGGVNFQTGDPNLGTLADNGGPLTGSGQPLLTFSLLPGSKAINTGYSPSCPAADQRGQPRNVGQCDRGAYERGSLRLIGSVTPNVNVPYHGLVTYTLVLSNARGTTDPNVWLTDPMPAGFTFERWIVSPTQTTLTANTIGWQGVLTNGTTLTWTFQARNNGAFGLPADYGDTVINVARAGGATDVGIRTETVLQMECDDPLTVQNLKNDGTCSLRAVVAAAAPGSTVVFRPEVAGQTIVLSPTLVISKDLTLDASALVSSPLLSGNSAVRVMRVATNNRVTLNRLTLAYGYTTDLDKGGGGLLIESGASVTLTHSLIYSNMAGVLARGGGIENWGTLLVQHSAIMSNTFSSVGGGIYSRHGMVTIQYSSISGNVDTGYTGIGGGIYQEGNALTIQNSTIAGNSAGGGAGGIYITGLGQSSSLLLINSTVSGNRAIDSGGIRTDFVTVTLTNSTLFDNYVPYANSTNGYRGDDSQLAFYNTVIASQWGIDCGGHFGFAPGINVNNFVGDGTCSDNGVNFKSGDPLLAPLADNGGDTLTHALLPGSPAIDAGDAAACPAADQRGIPRPQGAACDIGAYEARINLALTKAVTPNPNVPYHGPLTYTLVLSNAGEVGEPNMLLTDTLPAAVAFGAWVTQPAGTVVRAGNTFTWTGALNAHTALTFAFTATHVGLPREWVTNTAYFSGTTWAGNASAGFQTTAYIITPTAGIGGAITPSTVQVVNPGEDRSFAIAPNYGYHVLDVGVDGVSMGAINIYTFTNVMADHTISATFGLNEYALTTNVMGQGQITRMPDQATYLYGSSVTLTAVPQSGWYFGQWLGDASGTLTQTTVLMNANKVVTATFFNIPQTYYTLTLSLIGSGLITPTVGAHAYLSGTVVPLSASPAEGWQFIGWNGNADCADGLVTLNANKLCTATFAHYQVYLPLILK